MRIQWFEQLQVFTREWSIPCISCLSLLLPLAVYADSSNDHQQVLVSSDKNDSLALNDNEVQTGNIPDEIGPDRARKSEDEARYSEESGLEPLPPVQPVPPAERPKVPLSQLEDQMFELVNKDRALNGREPLRRSKKLNELAAIYARRLVNDGFYGHVDPEGRSAQVRMQEFGINFIKMGENIARFGRNGKRNDTQQVDHCEEAMMAEPPDQKNHRGNILNPAFRFVGIGMGRTDAKLSMVQEFCDVDPDAPAEAEK